MLLYIYTYTRKLFLFTVVAKVKKRYDSLQTNFHTEEIGRISE